MRNDVPGNPAAAVVLGVVFGAAVWAVIIWAVVQVLT